MTWARGKAASCIVHHSTFGNYWSPRGDTVNYLTPGLYILGVGNSQSISRCYRSTGFTKGPAARDNYNNIRPGERFLSKTKRVKEMTLREESLAENKELGLEQVQEQMDFIFGILHQHGINSQLWLEEYIAASQANGMKAPPDVESWLPWNLTDEQKNRFSKETFFEHGDAKFVRSNTGKTFLLQKDGSRKEMKIGDLTASEFEKLTGLCIS